LWLPSQNGLREDSPQRHSAIVARPPSMVCPSWVRTVKLPRTSSGPSS
jgi:hypothetical protein